jgi:hypothetical protein
MELAEEIRAAHRHGEKQVVLARRYNVHKGTISRIVKYLIYKPASDLSFRGSADSEYSKD